MKAQVKIKQYYVNTGATKHCNTQYIAPEWTAKSRYSVPVQDN